MVLTTGVDYAFEKLTLPVGKIQLFWKKEKELGIGNIISL